MIYQTPTRAFHAMAKPAGADCNLHCTYCFYLKKALLYPGKRLRRMNDVTLEAYVRGYIDATREEDEVAFTWQGGEPTLLGLDFYRKAVDLQTSYGQGRKISNSFQTNGMLIDENWCLFFLENDFLVGLSLDGPDYIHNAYRRTAAGGPSHDRALRALRMLRHYGVRFNVLACVNRKSSEEPLWVYESLRDSGARYIQFLPVVERPAGRTDTVTEWSVRPEDYGNFLTAVFDRWIRRDVGATFVMNFEWALANFMELPGTVCHHQPTCGRSVIVEHNGDVYSCDHFVYPEYMRGNIFNRSFADILDDPAQEDFGKRKFSTLTEQCRDCKMLKGCWGGCPKHRFAETDDGEPGQSYLCKGYYHFFGHIVPHIKAMAELIHAGRPASDIMGATLIFKHS